MNPMTLRTKGTPLCREASPRAGHRRSGVAMIVAIICLTLASAMAISLVQLTLASQQQAAREQWRLQSAWLAESGLARGAVRLRGDAVYNGETWTVDDLGAARERGIVTMTVDSGAEEDAHVTITAVADFPAAPAAPADRVRTTRTLTIRRGDEQAASSTFEESEQ